MKYLSLLFLLSSLLSSQERYSKIEISVPTADDVRRIEAVGIAADHFDGKIGESITLFVSETEQKQLIRARIPFTVLIADWQEYYNSTILKNTGPNLQAGVDTLKNFVLGSKGGHFTYAEIESNLLLMKQLYPHLITEKTVIGTSNENSNIYAVKISDNPNTDETAEPEVLYTALHHAREPQGMMTVMYYMWWLLENYDKDPEATYLVNNRQLWFIPVVNPDGYNFNAAGGMWRKNRRLMNTAGGKVYGIDLNRNYGPYDMWNAPNGGSSTSQSSDTYRGPEPFSEPETQAVRNFMLGRRIRTCFNYHTYGNYIIYPWGYSSAESGDSLLFRQWTFDMSANNRYSIGTDLQTVGYSTRGNSDDFMYGDTSKIRAYAMTPEVATTGFWAAPADIIPFAKINLLQNKLLAHYAGSYLEVRSFSYKNNLCKIILRNKGIGDLKSIPIYFESTNSIVPTVVQSGDIPSFAEREISITVFPVQNASAQIKFYLLDSVNTFFKGGLMKDSITFYTSNPIVLFSDSANSTAQWSMGSWGITDDGVENNSVFTDSPTGDYPINTDNSMTLSSPVNLTGFQFAELRFRTKWAIESTWDFGTIEISTNGGTTWSSVKTKYSRKGSGRSSKQPTSAYGYDAFVPGLTWIEQTADLTPYLDKQIKIRFRLNTDGDQQRDGWYVDDIRVLGYPFSPNAVNTLFSPTEYSLSQNFPNPFNPTTTIQFSVKEQSRTALRIYNSIGQLVTTLIDHDMAAGSYSINFDAEQLSSGVYFYRFTSGTFTDIKKMTVIR